MKIDRAVKDAFLAGLAAPVSLYSDPGPYLGATAIPSPAQSFALVGSRLTAAMGTQENDRSAGTNPQKPDRD